MIEKLQGSQKLKGGAADLDLPNNRESSFHLTTENSKLKMGSMFLTVDGTNSRNKSSEGGKLKKRISEV